MSDAATDTPGVASVAPPLLNQAGDTAVLTVTPTTGPQDQATQDLVHRLRDTTVPEAVEGTNATVLVGGTAATSIDSTTDLAGRIPYLIAGVVLLSMLLLLVAFRSIAVAVKAAAMNLLSVAASYGVVALVLQGGWAGQLIGIDTPTPLPPFVTVLMFAVLFGLSMDYEVFLLSRVRESWIRTGDNARAVTEGLAGNRPGHHGSRRDHDRGVRGLRAEPGRRPEADRCRHGRRHPPRRDRRTAPAGPGGDAHARPVQLVDPAPTRPQVAAVARRGPPGAPHQGPGRPGARTRLTRLAAMRHPVGHHTSGGRPFSKSRKGPRS
ncbi:MMPL family transporter [Streptomyces sp. GLT-R25]